MQQWRLSLASLNIRSDAFGAMGLHALSPLVSLTQPVSLIGAIVADGFFITVQHAPALGTLRNARAGDTVFIQEGAQCRKDWPRYVDAISTAVAKGADARWVR